MAIRMAGFCALFTTALLVGCQEPSAPEPPVLSDGHNHDHDHDHGHAHPESFSAAFAAVEDLNAQIAKGFAADDPEAAHGPLHEIAEALEHLEEFAKDLHLEDIAKEEVVAAVNTLTENFTAVDKKLHDQDGAKDYSEVKDSIDQAMETIETKAAEHLKDDHAGHDHDHEGHDDEHPEEEHSETSEK